VKAKIDNVEAKIQDKEEKGPCSRPTLARRLVFGQLAAAPTSSLLEGPPRQVSASHDKYPPRTTSLCLARQVSAPHDKSPPRTTSPAPTGAWAQIHGTSTATDARGGTILHAMQVQQLAAMQAARPDKSLNAGLTSCAAITSPSPPTLPHVSSARGTQAPSTNVHEPRLRLGRGRQGKCSGRLRQMQTTRRRSQASRNEQSNPATRRLPRQSITTQFQYAPTDNDE
jgi:hypothetical protein